MRERALSPVLICAGYRVCVERLSPVATLGGSKAAYAYAHRKLVRLVDGLELLQRLSAALAARSVGSPIARSRSATGAPPSPLNCPPPSDRPFLYEDRAVGGSQACAAGSPIERLRFPIGAPPISAQPAAFRSTVHEHRSGCRRLWRSARADPPLAAIRLLSGAPPSPLNRQPSTPP